MTTIVDIGNLIRDVYTFWTDDEYANFKLVFP